MKNFMFNSNTKKKISITSALFSLLILFFALNCGFCGNFCSAEYSNSEEETTNETETKTQNNSEEEDKKDTPPTNKTDNQDKINQQENNKTETQKPKRGDLCPSLFSSCKPW